MAYAKDLLDQLLEQVIRPTQMEAPTEENITAVLDLEYAPLNARFHLDGMRPEEWTEAFGKEELKQFYLQIYPDVGCSSAPPARHRTTRAAGVAPWRRCKCAWYSGPCWGMSPMRPIPPRAAKPGRHWNGRWKSCSVPPSTLDGAEQSRMIGGFHTQEDIAAEIGRILYGE